MTDHRDFEEPYAAPDATDNEKSTRWVLTVCFAILILAGIAFASIGTISRPTTSVFLPDPPQQSSQALIIVRPGDPPRLEM